jgi:DNA-binding winged helix-turn-helix (wHTH) protein
MNVDVIYRFGDCALDTNRRELRRGGVPCRLEPQVFDLLEFWIRNRERVVSKQDVFNSVWRGRIVSEAVRHTQLSAARRDRRQRLRAAPHPHAASAWRAAS